MTNDYLLLIVQFVGLNTTPYSHVRRRRMDLTHCSKWTNSHFRQEVAQATIGTLLLSKPLEFFHKSFPDSLNCRHEGGKKVHDFLLRKGKTINCEQFCCSLLPLDTKTWFYVGTMEISMTLDLSCKPDCYSIDASLLCNFMVHHRLLDRI